MSKAIRIMTVVGARPQFVKAAVIGRRIKDPDFRGLQETLVHTGQHYDPEMSQVFFEELGIAKPEHHLGVGSGSHGAQTGSIMSALETVVSQDRPDMMLVYGDTNSTLAAALVAAKASIPLAHVEAGLRSFRRGMPEEINRVVTDRLSDLLFCPTGQAVTNLADEGRRDAILVGDVMYDGFLHEMQHAVPDVAKKFGLAPKQYVLATVHRAENTDRPERLTEIVNGLAQSALPVLLTLHPRTRAALERYGVALNGAIKAVPPQSYRHMISLLRDAAVVATDSGGLQKEAAFARVPCVTLRDETEWLETVASGWNRLAPSDAADIAASLQAAMRNPDAPPPNYGDGDAGGLILSAIRDFVARSHQ